MKHLKRIPLTKQDTAWINETPVQLKKRFALLKESIEAEVVTISSIPKAERTFENTPRAIADTFFKSSEDSPIDFLAYVSPKAPIRAAAEEIQIVRENFYNNLKTNPELFSALDEYLTSAYKKEKKTLAEDSKKLVEDLRQDFSLEGLGLDPKKQKELKKLSQKITKIELDFGKELRTYEDYILITKEQAAELPDSLTSQLQTKDGQLKVDLSYPVAGPFLSHCSDPKLRQKLADKLSAKGGKKNLKRMEKLLALRYEVGKIMGYPTFADYKIAPKMAKDLKTARAFSLEIIEKTKAARKRNHKELEKFKQKLTGNKKDKLRYYDAHYYSRLMIEEKFSYDPEETRQYFPLDQVIEGTFWLMKKLFNLTFTKSDLPSWHKDVMMYEVREGKNHLGTIGLDLFPRANKYSHVCNYPVINIKETSYQSGETKGALSTILGQFPKPSKKSPSLLSYREVETFLHEFGHMIHGIISEGRHPMQGGSATTFDFVEVPSQLFENWLGVYEVVQKFTKHHQTGKKMPKELFEKIQDIQRYGRAGAYNSAAITQLFDLEIHSQKPMKDLGAFYNKLSKKHGGTGESSPKSTFPGNFGHLVNTMYVAGYYGYLWSLVYAQDCFSVFEKEGVLSRKVGKRLVDEILSVGGSRDDNKSLKAFLGRKQNSKAFLRWAGIK